MEADKPSTRQTADPTSEALSAPDALINRDEGLKYWNSVANDADGMLGGVPTMPGLSAMSRVDLQGSRSFLAKLGIGAKPGLRMVSRALEGGAGIGRITEGLLLKICHEVDIIEPVEKFTDALKGKNGIGRVFNVGLEGWSPAEHDQYDLIWTQWCVGHLTDAQLVTYLETCRRVLNPETGIIVIKENLSTREEDVFDATDSSVTRQDVKFRSLFKQANLRIVKTELQKGLPKKHLDKLMPIRVYALRPQ
ncbi:hypothetical protein JX265_013855 [Neoarthrinium moseri]|uniref:Alpha N-terminal protein methyltransferase 1 n=1 Tax=Neoarthrinium moseri TaxID=1658444 RepID=A0A9P9W7V5_9PEZI|nr:uncharacterized protein JN550_013750 [Neoarthrinium moseri]KAI1840071.1 hypothetical protein JX266_013721 [Neoarthrinium moseri]KAI1848100.1 hypothetical protein JX265_013855 [Neoarthrinium moseri]KAI1856643.1 hypothetical protein JN550_013750 [Neoarthrinium moseri]